MRKTALLEDLEAIQRRWNALPVLDNRTADEILVAGKVSEVMDEIDVKRREAQARNGWIMDTYMIRKPERG